MLIRVLDEFLINQIAAGEVIEHPYSVVKELVENSIDANSTSIVVEAKDGGLSYIRVTDNGDGMDEVDCALCFERHATSKITSARDLERVVSLGFRGEALASIAAVSQTEMFSCLKEAQMGTHIINHGGRIISQKGYGCPKGTSIIVRNLFYNVPARLKFLKSTKTEASGITELMSRLILGSPKICFKYVYDDKTVYSSPGDGYLLSAINAVYGTQIKNEIINIQKEDIKGLSLCGYIGKSSIARKNRNHQSFFVNGRYIKNYMLSACIGEAYKSYLAANHYPWVVLNLSIPNDVIDVNVHPAKTQVRFKEERYVYQTVLRWVREALLTNSTINGTNDNAKLIHEPTTTLYASTPVSCGYPFPSIERFAESEEHIQLSVRDIDFVDSPTQIDPEIAALKNYRLIGSAFNTYIIVQGENDVFLIDTHAAHERMLFEKYKDDLAFKKVSVQLLLSPLIVDVSAAGLSYLTELIVEMKNSGFDIEIFDMRSVIIRGIPSILSGVDVKDFFRDLLDVTNLNPYADNNSRSQQIIKLACKKAVKANTALSNMEILYILDSVIMKRIPSTCPHGRPITVTISKNELESRFKRR